MSVTTDAPAPRLVPSVRPRAWQVEALNAWEDAGQRGIVDVVTGAGKTTLALLCLARFLQRHPPGRVVLIVPTLALLDQWYVSLREDLGLPDTSIAAYSGQGRAPHARTVNVVVLNTARHLAPQLSTNGPDAFLIVDECHRAGSPENLKALDGQHTATLGLSATPNREYDQALTEELIPRLGEVIYTYDYNRARAEGVIAPYTLVNVAVDLLPPEQDDYDRLSRRVSILSRRQMQGDDVEIGLKRALQERAAVSNRAAMRVPMSVSLVEMGPARRAVVFHEQIAAAEKIAGLLRARGANVGTYHSKIGPELRRDNLRMFRRGQLEVLVSCRALDEGVNVPEASVAVIASATASNRQRIQRLGRVLRPAPGKTSATIYTIYATAPEERRLAREAEHLVGADSVAWLRGIWREDA
jgi:superfamily II DNA or RNA helicase